MFLSNPHAAAIAVSLLIVTAAGCSWIRSNDPVTLTQPAVAPPETGLPFEAREPATYQADFVTIAGGSETRSHFARKDSSWRVDLFAAEKATRSIIKGEKYVYVDHTNKQLSEPPLNGPDPQPAFIGDLTASLLNEKQPAKFEKLSTEGTLERYGVTAIDGTAGKSTIVFDTSIGMIVRHEFDGNFAFEMRNFTLEVDDATFAAPSGYRRVAWRVFNGR